MPPHMPSADAGKEIRGETRGGCTSYLSSAGRKRARRSWFPRLELSEPWKICWEEKGEKAIFQGEKRPLYSKKRKRERKKKKIKKKKNVTGSVGKGRKSRVLFT